jgi:hypothetical protein
MLEKTKQLHPKYTRARTSGDRAEVYDSERHTWLPLWIALGYLNHAEMVEQCGTWPDYTGSTDTWESGADTYGSPEVDGAFDGGGGE